MLAVTGPVGSSYDDEGGPELRRDGAAADEAQKSIYAALNPTGGRLDTRHRKNRSGWNMRIYPNFPRPVLS